MHGHEVEFPRVFAQQVGGPFQHVAVRSAVEAIAADAVLLCQAGGYGIKRCDVWDGAMECRIENGVKWNVDEFAVDRLN